MSYSTIATIDNLNTVYSDIRHRIDALGDVYSVKGSLTCANLEKLRTNKTKVAAGDVYNVSDDGKLNNDALKVSKGENVVYVGYSGTGNWSKLGGVYELANNTTAGLVFLGEETDFDNDTANALSHVEFGLNMGSTIDEDNPEKVDGKVHKTYVKVPFASDKIYGLVSTTEQTFAGDKIFNGNVIVNNGTTKTTIANNSITVGEKGDTSTGTLTINGGVITADSSSFLGTLTVNNTTTTQNLTVNNATDGTVGKITVEGTATVNSEYSTENLTVLDTTEVGVVTTDQTYATTNKDKGVIYTKNPITTENLKVSNLFETGTLNADTVTVTNLTGTGNNSTLNTQTINAKGTDGSVTMKYISAGETIVAGSSTNTTAPQKGFVIGDVSKKDTGLYVSGHLYAYKVHNAVWNDLADAIEIDCSPEPGYAYCFDGEHYFKSSKYCQKGIIGIHSDTAGMIIGEKGGENELNCAVAGFVLAYVDKVYPSGTPLTTGNNGVLTKMKKKDLILHPDRLVANFWKVEVGEKWNGVEVNNRCWVKVR